MTKSAITAVANIQTLVAGLAGMRLAPSMPPDAMSAFPFGISYISAVDARKTTASNKVYLYTIVTEIHVARKDLSRDVDKLDAYPTSFPDAIWADPTLSGAVDTVNQITGKLVPAEWGGVDTLAWHFETEVKISGA